MLTGEELVSRKSIRIWPAAGALFCQRDTAATEAAIEQAHTVALAAAGAVCRSGVDLGKLGYASIVDMNIDIDVFCRELEQRLRTRLRVYVQDFVICPDSICGNGMREPGERCDDGNTVSGDSCRADC